MMINKQKLIFRLMGILLLLAVLQVCVGCGKFRSEGIIDPEIKPYYDEYKDDKEEYTGVAEINNMHIQFEDQEPGTQASCTKRGQFRFITIDPVIWAKYNKVQKKLLLYHELGHCDLGKGHADWASIMNPYSLPSGLYLQDEKYFLQELFDGHQ